MHKQQAPQHEAQHDTIPCPPLVDVDRLYAMQAKLYDARYELDAPGAELDDCVLVTARPAEVSK